MGHILFTKALVNNIEVLALAPLSVLPYPKYYSKAGYVPAGTYGIKAPFPVEDEDCFMAICFDENAGRLDGFIEYDKAFGI